MTDDVEIKVVLVWAALNPYHREKLTLEIGEWRMKNHPVILLLMRSAGVHAKACAPTGAIIFDHKNWSAENWYCNAR